MCRGLEQGFWRWLVDRLYQRFSFICGGLTHLATSLQTVILPFICLAKSMYSSFDRWHCLEQALNNAFLLARSEISLSLSEQLSSVNQTKQLILMFLKCKAFMVGQGSLIHIFFLFTASLRNYSKLFLKTNTVAINLRHLLK